MRIGGESVEFVVDHIKSPLEISAAVGNLQGAQPAGLGLGVVHTPLEGTVVESHNALIQTTQLSGDQADVNNHLFTPSISTQSLIA